MERGMVTPSCTPAATTEVAVRLVGGLRAMTGTSHGGQRLQRAGGGR